MKQLVPIESCGNARASNTFDCDLTDTTVLCCSRDMADLASKDFVQTTEKVFAGDHTGALAAAASVLATAATGNPVLGAMTGGSLKYLATKLLDTADKRLKACEAQLNSEEERRAEFQRQLAKGVEPLTTKLEDLTQLNCEQLLQMLRYVEQNVASAEGQATVLASIDRLIEEISRLRPRLDITWTSAHREMVVSATGWLREVEASSVEPARAEAARAIFNSGILVKTSRCLDSRFRWIVEQAYILRWKGDDNTLRGQIRDAVVDIALKERMLSCLETSLGALEATDSELVDEAINGRIAHLCEHGRRILKMLGPSGMTPFNVKADMEAILNGLDRTEGEEMIGYLVDAIEKSFTVIDRAVLREAERAFSRLAATLVQQHRLPSPLWSALNPVA